LRLSQIEELVDEGDSCREQKTERPHAEGVAWHQRVVSVYEALILEEAVGKGLLETVEVVIVQKGVCLRRRETSTSECVGEGMKDLMRVKRSADERKGIVRMGKGEAFTYWER